MLSAFMMASLQERLGARVKPLIVVLHEETVNQRKSNDSALVLELCVQHLLESLSLELNVGHTSRWRNCPFSLVSA